jgi:hypothetical protein
MSCNIHISKVMSYFLTVLSVPPMFRSFLLLLKLFDDFCFISVFGIKFFFKRLKRVILEVRRYLQVLVWLIFQTKWCLILKLYCFYDEKCRELWKVNMPSLTRIFFYVVWRCFQTLFFWRGGKVLFDPPLNKSLQNLFSFQRYWSEFCSGEMTKIFVLLKRSTDERYVNQTEVPVLRHLTRIW